jgi:hypothetical protein
MRLGGPREHGLPVFIPHTSADDGLANALYRQLRLDHEIHCHVENVDYLMNPGAVSRAIVDRLAHCTGIIALATPDTLNRWQMAYSLGVAGCAQRLSAVYVAVPPDVLPDYLSQWPMLHTPSDVQQFAHYFKRHNSAIVALTRHKPPCEHQTAARAACDEFTRRMKVVLGQ